MSAPIHRDLCDGGSSCTLNDSRSPAAACRARGWGVGTVLVGDEGRGPARIVITAIGEKQILARRESDISDYEGSWFLNCRCWGEP